ncbi:TMV resistance protein N-like isoform X2 [Diospyros lotus]|uniref:TMV resistance protein N-like isoform X2 n=1 Tax=Diospyros lotus TaxID=55363 RepID=UPI0022520E78|nr:TMV resistance protein N-like isoform X2 [Diospyros lotus]
MASTRTQLQDAAFLPSGSSSWKYDVFLSFRGSDTRHGFVEHLYSALREMVIFPYQDDPKLEKGESISTALLKAIEESRLAVVIFSENYASSKWCLEELVKILDCQKTRGLTVLPVFYKVNPSDLQKQRGSVGEAFARHERDSSEEEEKQKVRRWRNALMEAASISGWDSNTHGPEAKLVHDIVIHILSILGYNGSSILEDVVGLYPRVAKVISLLEMGLELDDPRIVGIWGMGGIGKTTIAKAVYHQIRSQFHASCYLPNVREAAGVHGLESLQKSLFKDLSVSDNDIKIRNIDEPRTIMNRVRCKRVLVVLDDVDHSDQLDALVGRLDRFDPGSRIIITTRDRHLLARYGKSSSVYSVEGLNDEEAFKLFCCKAFRNNQPTPGFEHLIKRAVDYAKGVPLALKVLGCFLIGRKVNEWQSAIHRLGQEPNPDIQKALILSYEGLAHEEQEIFLDIACFFKRYSEYYTVVNILDACGFHTDIGIRILEDKALVTIRDNKIDVHDLIQEMGRHIVYKESSKEPGRRSRLWKYEDIYDTLTKKTGTKAVETIVFDSHETKEVFLSPDTFSKMSRLRLLKLSNVQLPDGLDYLSNDLRLLDWHEYPLKYLPSNFQPHSLVKLKMSSSCLERPWNGTMCLDKLKYVDLSYSLCMPKNLDFTQVTNLKELILEGANLVEIDPSIEAIKRLTFLNLRGCKYLKVLPMGWQLKSLKQLVLSGCSELKNVSKVLASTECLIKLDLDGTCVKELPVKHLSNLQFISLRDCQELTSLPSGICGLKLLASLNVSGCSKLSKLPKNLGGLERLQELRADFTAIKQPPFSIIHLKELRVLSFLGCKGGVTSTQWKSLFSSFQIHQDPMGFELPALSGLHSLLLLDLRNCHFSEGFLPDDLGSLSSLQCLYLSGANIITLPTSIRGLSQLTTLELMDCKELKRLPNLPKNIVSINASGCTSLETFPTILPRKLAGVSLMHCHTLLKNRPSLPLELLRNYLEGFNDFPEFTIIVPGREIPKCFRYQNNMGHHVRIQLLPDWYQRLRGFVVCAVFEAKAPPIDAQVHVECYGMRNDDVIYATDILIGSFQFQSDHLLFDCMALGEGSWKVGGYDLKTWTEIIFYFSSYSPEMFVPDKCAVHIVYENDKEWPDPHASVQQWMQGIVLKKGSRHIFDYKIEIGEQSNPKRLRDTADSQSELSEISFQSIGDSAAELSEISIPIIGDSGAELPEISVHSIRDSAAELDIIHRVSRGKFEPGRNSFWPRWTDGRIEAVGFDHPCFGGGIWFSVAKSP